MIKVSVIVPVYNVEKYLPKCLDSLVNQTLNDIEIIVVNDGSPDNSQKIIDEYVKNYPKKIKAFIKENGGLGDARNYGLNHAVGKYIGYVDSDDYVELNMFEKLYKKAIKSNADIVASGYNVVNENYEITNSVGVINNQNGKDIKHQVFLGDNAAWNKIYKKDLIIKNEIEFRSKIWYEDLDYKIKVLVNSSKIEIVDEYLYNYLVRNGSIMNNSNLTKNLDILVSFNEAIEYCQKNKIYKKYFDEIEFLCIQHVYIFAIARVANIKVNKNEKMDVVNTLKSYVKDNFKNFKNNKYIKRLSFNKKIIYNLINYNQYWLIKIIFKFKRK